MPHGVIFDIDGTLLLSNQAHARAWVDAFSEYGYEIPFERIYPLIGMGGDKVLATLTPGLSEDKGVGKQIAQRRTEIFLNRYVNGLQPSPGARSLVQHIKADRMKAVIATSAKEKELERLVKAAHVDDLFEYRTTSNEVEKSKPEPDVVEAALKKIGMLPNQVVMIGDTPYDVEAAKKLGIGTIAVRSGGHNDRDLRDAIAVYDDPADILRHYAESPLASSRTAAGVAG